MVVFPKFYYTPVGNNLAHYFIFLGLNVMSCCQILAFSPQGRAGSSGKTSKTNTRTSGSRTRSNTNGDVQMSKQSGSGQEEEEEADYDDGDGGDDDEESAEEDQASSGPTEAVEANV